MKTANFPRSFIIETYGKFPFAVNEDDWLISIADPAAFNAVPKVKFGKILFLNFADVELNTPGEQMTDKAKQMLALCGAITDAQAEQIAEFIKEARELKKNVWVNCHAGMCRSGAVVRLLIELGWTGVKYHGQPDRVPNLLVYNKIRRHFPELNQSWDTWAAKDTHITRMAVGDIVSEDGGHGEITKIDGTKITVLWDYSGESQEYEHADMNFFWYGSGK